MSTEKHAVTVGDLVEEAKKRIVLLIVCAVGLSYLLSLTSSSVWVNLPAAASLIVTIRYFALDFEMRRKAAGYNNKPTFAQISCKTKPFGGPDTGVMKSDWRRKVNSPVVEDALDQFTRHLVSEWVMDLWYSRLTPDRQGPEEVVHIMHGVLGEISSRLRNVNLIDLLTRDVISVVCAHLELFHSSQSKIEMHQLGPLTFERRDLELKSVLFADNKLHPALFSAEAEHKVLQHLMDGLMSLTLKPEDLQCSLFRFTVRELLACAVMRPVLNLANPRFLNERVESLAISLSKASKGADTLLASQSKLNSSSQIPFDHIDPSIEGVELVPVKKDPSKTLKEKSTKDDANGTHAKDPLLCMDTRATLSWSSQPLDAPTGDGRSSQRHHSGEDRDGALDVISGRETKVLAPSHFERTESGWCRRKEDENYAIEPETKSSSATYKTAANLKVLPMEKEEDSATKISSDHSNAALSRGNGNLTNHGSAVSYVDFDENDLMRLEEVESGSSSYTSDEDDETGSVNGIGYPFTKVWDGKTNRYPSVSHIHHPLESSEGCNTRKGSIGNLHSGLHRTRSRRKRFNRLSSQERHIWQEVERTSFSSGDSQDILNSLKGNVESEDSSDDYEAEVFGRIHSGATASSSTSSTSLLDCDNLAMDSQKNSLLADSFLKLRCEVLGANIVKGGSRTFAVYSIAVTDTDENTWYIKRRFRHFEELHRRLKEFPEYNLHLPPKRFLSTGLDVVVIQERCKLLNKYLKKLLQLPTISGSIEIWDFLSVDSQTYVFSNTISIIERLSVDLDSTTHGRSEEAQSALGQTVNPLPSHCEHHNAESKESALAMKHNIIGDVSEAQAQGTVHTREQNPSVDSDQGNISLSRKSIDRIKGDDLQAPSQPIIGAASDPTLPSEWVPPNLSAPLLDLVDVVFQLQDGGWIRRKAFWVAKQILQLGMGDAFDDWLIEKIQLLRRGSVVASGIKQIEQVLWPDGIFITKHPKRRRQANPPGSTPQSSPPGHPPPSVSSPKKVDAVELDENQQREAERRARFVHELMIDNAPAAIVGLVGHKGYEQCARDIYYFLQSSLCLKQLAFELLELLLLSAFPEMDKVFHQLHEEKEKFGEFRPT